MDIDDVFREIGEFGKHQKKIFSVVCGLQAVFSFHMVHMVFIGAEPDVYCATGDKLLHSCGSVNDTCIAYRYHARFTSIASQWHLVCGDAYKVGLVQSCFMAGVLIGAVLFGSLSDRFGRRKIFYITMAGLTTFAFASSFSTSYTMYSALRFLAGIFCGGAILLSFVLGTELVGPSKRAFCGTVIPVMFAIGIMVFAGLAYVIPQWRMLSVATAVPAAFVFLCYNLIPESPRWLLSQGQVTQAESVLEHIAQKNSGQTPKKPVQLRAPGGSTGTRYGLMDLLKDNVLRKRTLVLTYSWFVNSAVYYGLTMSAGGLGSNLYISVCLSGVVEMPAYLSTFLLLDRLGRRYTFSGFMLIGGAACLTILVLPAGHGAVMTSLALIGKLSISASFCVAYIYSAELYPTVVRNNGLGVCSMAARTGGILAPMIVPLGNVYPSLQFVVFGSMSLVGGMLSLLLPETLGQPMPETLQDLYPSPKPLHDLAAAPSDKEQLLEEESGEQ